MKSKLLFNILCRSPGIDVNLRQLNIINRRSINGMSYKHHRGEKPLQYLPLGKALSEAANKWPGQPAIISTHENKSITFVQLLEQSDRLAAAFKELGLTAGDRVGIWAPNFSHWIVTLMAAARSGLVSVAINHMYQARELEYALKKVGVKVLVAPGSCVSDVYYKILNEIIDTLPSENPHKLVCNNLPDLSNIILFGDENSRGTLSFEKLMASASQNLINNIERTAPLVNPDSACNIQYTSGTTGDPKAAILSHYNIINNGFAIGLRNELDTGAKKICVQVPLFHVFGVVVSVSAAIQHGSTLVFPSGIYSPKANLEAIIKEKCDVIYGTPTMHIDLVNQVKTRGVTGLKADIAVTGGAPVTPKLVQNMATTLGVSKVKSIFGMTEGTAVSFHSLPGEDPERPLHFLGHLHDHLEAKVVDGENKQVPFGKAGELLIRGYSTMMGYWDDEKKTKETLDQSGWLRTGDQVVLSEDGYCQVVGRLKDIIIRGGENIAPKEIEDVFSSHPDVLECQAFGVADERLGEEICLAVRLREGALLDASKLTSHASATLAKYKIPKLIKQIDEFPKTTSGKVQKFKLREMVETGKL